ncbi:rhomboid-like protease 3 [Cyclospora cayetanensis]|uniref:Rhomboid-like protease n=1 Tax=Cyclospora cayetanensis TaxID=88456 RepID=A0A6P6RPY2_9EIME|nr:rhomboid-like protease 3 [Cyclospora cayetanensis]
MSDIESQRDLGAGLPRTNRIIDVAFPGLSMDKSIVLISLAQLGFYVLSCAMSSAFKPSGRVLYQLGATYGPAIRHFQAWRLLMPVFLHAGIVHFLFNTLFILHMGLDKEAKYGRRNLLILYFSSALIGNMFTVLMHPCSLAVGASTAGFGLVGSILAEILIVWHKLDDITRNSYMLDVTVFGALMILLSYGQSVDFWGHLGGFVCGIALTCEFNKHIRDLPSWFGLVLNGARTICLGIAILTVSRVFFGIPLPMGCA